MLVGGVVVVVVEVSDVEAQLPGGDHEREVPFAGEKGYRTCIRTEFRKIAASMPDQQGRFFVTVNHTRIGMGSGAGDVRKTARAYVLQHCLGWVSGMRKPCVLQHSVGLGVPGACPDVARAVFCSICLGLGAGDKRKPCVCTFC